MTGSKHTRRKSKRKSVAARRSVSEGHDSGHTQESHSHAHSGSEPMVREDHGVPSRPLDYNASMYKRCHYRGIWNPCYCLCCKDSLKCGCIVFGSLTLVCVLPLLGNCVYGAIVWSKMPETEMHSTYLILTIALYSISIICFLVEGILSLVAVLKRFKNGIYAYIIIGIVVWLLMQLLVVIVILIWWHWEIGKGKSAPKPPTDEQMKFQEDHKYAFYDLFAIIPILFFLLLFMWPYSIVTHAVLWKRHVELGSGDMVRDDGV